MTTDAPRVERCLASETPRNPDPPAITTRPNAGRVIQRLSLTYCPLNSPFSSVVMTHCREFRRSELVLRSCGIPGKRQHATRCPSLAKPAPKGPGPCFFRTGKRTARMRAHLQPPPNSPPGLDLKIASKTAFGGSGRLRRFRDPKA